MKEALAASEECVAKLTVALQNARVEGRDRETIYNRLKVVESDLQFEHRLVCGLIDTVATLVSILTHRSRSSGKTEVPPLTVYGTRPPRCTCLGKCQCGES